MTQLSGKRQFYKKDRLYGPLLTFMTAYDSISIATECMKKGVLDRSPGNIAIEAHQFHLWVKFPMLAATDAMTKNIVPEGFEYIFSPNKGKSGPELGPRMSGYKSTSMAIVSALFIEFYEEHKGWIKNQYGSDTKNWPPLFNFARAIRNFIVHHQGKVHFDNPNADAVTWHHLSYSPADEGEVAVGHGYISVGDMIILFVELGDLFDSEGCPYPV